MHKSMKEFTVGVSKFQAVNVGYVEAKYSKGDILRLSSLNDLRDEKMFVLLRNDESGKLIELYLGDLKDDFVPL